MCSCLLILLYSILAWTVADAQRALDLLELYHSRIDRPQDVALRSDIERVIEIFRSRLFNALLGQSNIY